MNEVNIKFENPQTGEIIHDYPCQIPETIEEMDTRTFISWCLLINKGYEPTELKLRAFILFARLDIIKLARKVPSANPYEIFTQVLHLIDPLIAQSCITKDMFSESTLIQFKGYNGPGDYMADITFKQYALADNSFMLYIEEGKEDDLNEFCAALFSIDGFFDPKQFKKTTKHFSKVKMPIKQAILHNYWGLRNWQKSIWPLAFTESSQEVEKSEIVSEQLQLTDWDGLSINIAESHVFGVKEQVDKSPVNEVLKFIHDRKTEHLKRKKNDSN